MEKRMTVKSSRNLGGPASDRDMPKRQGKSNTWTGGGASYGKGGTHECPTPKHLKSKKRKRTFQSRAQATVDVDYQ
jgi:hypothetical protein